MNGPLSTLVLRSNTGIMYLVVSGIKVTSTKSQPLSMYTRALRPAWPCSSTIQFWKGYSILGIDNSRIANCQNYFRKEIPELSISRIE
jgi:hypothetical protein